MNSASRHLHFTPTFVELGRVNGTADERMQPEVQTVRTDIHLGVRLEFCMAEKKWDLAARISRYLAEKYPDQPQWWICWGNALKEMGKVRQAKKITKRGLKTHPDLTVFHFNLACYDCLLGRFRAARKRLRWIINLNPRLHALSMNDPDLARLWDWIGTEE